MSQTIHQVAQELRDSLIEYIEATYHIGDPALLMQRRTLLEELGVVHQTPYLESTPRYQAGRKFSEIPELSPAAEEVYTLLATPNAEGKRILYDPPYTHQSAAIEKSLVNDFNLLIMTGTGSGKTESFLMPILGKLAAEAKSNPSSFAQTGMRAMILYPMNALVNDQLGRLRGIFGDPRLVELFNGWAGRPPRFARYTSRTPYAGVRTKAKDQRNLKQFGDFYVKALQEAKDPMEEGDKARRLIADLIQRGKWPAKPNLEAWFMGPTGRFWQDKNDEFIRAVTLADDSELITRHEVQTAAPDLLVTNYSMLEYMLMRPVERTIFDQTKQWLADNPNEKFLLVLDESHLYKGAGGAEVGLLLRRLRDRLDIPLERFRTICATASFESVSYAPKFASQLTGSPPESFRIITGDLLERPGAAVGSAEDAVQLSGLDMDGFYSSDAEQRGLAVESFLQHLGSPLDGTLEQRIFTALDNYPPLALLINETMGKARAVEHLGGQIFPNVPLPVADQALTNLGALATAARMKDGDPSLLPCRVHNFFRGLRGLWACMDPACTAIDDSVRGVVGKLYTQPRDMCSCNSRVLELYTCRACGNAYARGYCNNAEQPTVVWSEAGAPLRMSSDILEELTPLDILLVPPGSPELAEAVRYDLSTGEINSPLQSKHERIVYLSPDRIEKAVTDDEDEDGTFIATAGVFHQCGVCERKSYQGRSSVQDHETKGDQPFQVLLNRQLQVQPPGAQAATKFAPLRGRKVLAFSDSRQVAARLAPNLQMYSARDSLRPLMVRGWKRIAQIPGFQMRIDDLYSAVLIAANELDVRMRPELSLQETFSDYVEVGKQVADGILESDVNLRNLVQDIRGGDDPPEALLADIMSTLRDRLLGLESLAIASVVERDDKRKDLIALPDIPGVTETPEDRVALARAWLREWNVAGFWLPRMKQRWYLIHPDKKVRVSSRSGKFTRLEKKLGTPAARKVFKEKWIPKLLGIFTEPMDGKHRLQGLFLSLRFDGEWVRCADCKSVHRPVRLVSLCLDCGHAAVQPMNPDTDDVFIKRKGYYRRGILAALSADPVAPVSIIAAEHTAQLNSAEKDEVFSKAEENELRFQDVQIPTRKEKRDNTAIDVLSSTTTMEVGIDIGQLSGVALRNMPPSRANYQQRAGRAGRRGNAIATVVAFGGSDTHDEYFFSEPAEMIAGRVVDPTLSVDNPDIAKRHIRAFLLQCYMQHKIPEGYSGPGDLFSVLGKVGEFLVPTNILSRVDFENWLNENGEALRTRVGSWMPVELTGPDRLTLLDDMVDDCLRAIDEALCDPAPFVPAPPLDDEVQYLEMPPQVNEEKPANPLDLKSLLDTLLYKGVLPRYAFPTDVATFHVFDAENSTRFRPKLKFAPAQGLAVALTQYAPGKQIWISGKCYTSGAIYSPMSGERPQQWRDRRLHLECASCGFAFTRALNQGIDYNQVIDCEACGATQKVGPAKYWMRPTGFAHPVDIPEVTSPDDLPETSYATRAKLTLKTEENEWTALSPRIRYLTRRTHLLVSNTGPGKNGYAYCTKCGRIEAETAHRKDLVGQHPKPFPDRDRPYCSGGNTVHNIVLGTDFVTDVALFSLRLASPLRLRPADSVTRIALRTVSEALSRAATKLLGIEPGEVLAEFRPAITPLGVQGLETEIFLYDTSPGGAGFAKEAAGKGLDLFTEALKIMESCAEKCDLSCYRCLRSFRNRMDHGALDRFTGIALLQYLMTGSLQPFEERRLESATHLLFTNLLRQNGMNFEAHRLDVDAHESEKRHHKPIVGINGNGRSVLISVINPLEEPSEARLVSGLLKADAIVVEINELIVRQNLPKATEIAMHQIVGA